MVKKRRPSILSDDDEEKLSKLSKKERAQAVYGKPDSTDVRLLSELFGLYEKHTHGKLTEFLKELEMERTFIPNLQPITTAEKFKYSFPADLEEELRHWWPSIWTEKDHARWLLTKFPQFRSG